MHPWCSILIGLTPSLEWSWSSMNSPASRETNTICTESPSSSVCILVSAVKAAIINHSKSKPTYWLHNHQVNNSCLLGWTNELRYDQCLWHSNSLDLEGGTARNFLCKVWGCNRVTSLSQNFSCLVTAVQWTWWGSTSSWMSPTILTRVSWWALQASTCTSDWDINNGGWLYWSLPASTVHSEKLVRKQKVGWIKIQEVC